MKPRIALVALLIWSVTVCAQEVPKANLDVLPDTFVVSSQLIARLDSLSLEMGQGRDLTLEDISDNPMYFKLFMPIVLYGSAVSDAISPEDKPQIENYDLLPLTPLTDNTENTLSKMIDEALLQIYLEHPELVEMTEVELMDVPGIIPISMDQIRGIGDMNLNNNRFKPAEDKSPDMYYYKPRYWKTFGSFQGKYTQSHYSDNWYRGGESNHSVLGQLNLEANYARDTKTLDNKLELKLGYYTTEINEKKTIRTNEDLIRITSKGGLKAWKDWDYSAQIQAYTQFMPVYDTKVTTKLKSKFFAPAYGNIAVGMDYKPKFKKLKNTTLSLQLSPLSYNCRYVSVDSIATNYGIDKGKNFKSTFGSRLECNVKWKFMDDFTWTSKTQYYTSYETTEINLENTLDYQLSKYFSLQFFCHWRFDDSVKRKKDRDGNLMGYDQFKEFLTLNFKYAW